MSDLSIKPNFIILNDVDPTTIGLADTSSWGINENQPAYITIIPPGSIKAISLNFIKHNIMFLTSVNLGISCLTYCGEQKLQPLDDGVWEFCLKSNFEGIEKKRLYLKTDSLRIEMDKLYIKEGIEYNPNSNVVKALAEAEWLLNVAEANIRDGNSNKAMQAFNLAVKEVKKYSNCKDCI